MRNDRVNANEYNTGSYAAAPDSANPQPYPGAVFPAAPVRRSGKLVPRLIAFIIVIIVLLILLQSLLFRVNTVYIIGNDTVAAEHIVALSGLTKGDSIVSLSADTIRKKLESDHWITLIDMYKQYPGTVYLVVDEREVVAVLQYLGIEYTLDIDGMVMAEYPDMDYDGDGIPVVYGFDIGSATVGQELSVSNSAQLTAYSAIVTELSIQRYTDQIKSINVNSISSLSLQTVNGITVELGNSDYMRAKIGAMRTDIAYLQQLGEASGVLDVTMPEDGKFKRE